MRHTVKVRSAGMFCVSFGVLATALLFLFFAAVNTGSIHLGIAQLWNGLFVEYDPDVAAVYDLRFPRILISLMAGATLAAAGTLFQAVTLWQIREFWVLPAGQSLRQFWQQPWFHNFIVLCRHSAFWEEFLPSLSYIAWRGQAVFLRCVLFCWALQYSLCSGDCLLHLVQQAVEPHRR